MCASRYGFGLGFFLMLASSAAMASPNGASTASSSAGGSVAYPSCAGKVVSGAESEAAHKIYLAGRVQYDDSNWEAAISQFREAYRRDCTKHELLIILSRAYEAKGERREARLALQTFLERVPDSPDATALRSRLANIQRQIEKDDEKARQTSEMTSAPAPATPSSASAAVTEPPAPVERRGHTALPWIVAGVGAAALTTGIVLLVTAPAIPPNCNEQSSTCAFRDGVTRDKATPEQIAQNDRDSRQANDAVTMNLAGTVTAIAGGALVLGGLAWHFLEPTGPADADRPRASLPRIAPFVGLRTAGLSLAGSF